MRENGVLQCGGCPQIMTTFDSDKSGYAKHYARYGFYAQTSSDSPPDRWSICNSTDNSSYNETSSACEHLGNGDEEERGHLQNGRHDQEQGNTVFLNPEADCSRLDIDGRVSNRLEAESERGKRKAFFCGKFEKENSHSIASEVAFDSGDDDDDSGQVQVLKASPTSSISRFMSPQDQSMLATPGNGNSPGYNIASSPHSASAIPVNNFRSANGCCRTSSNASEGDAPDLQMPHPAMSLGQTMISDCSTSECEATEAALDDMKYGENQSKRKMSSGETIYPWMKESRQNQKKKQSTSVSSSEENEKGFTGNKRERTAYTNSQLVELEKEFHYSHYLCRPRRIELANTLNLSERQIKIWFQNRRMKFKKEQKQKIAMPRSADVGSGIGALALSSGHQRHYPFPYFHQQHRPIPYSDDSEDKCKTARFPRMGSNGIPYPIHTIGRKESASCCVTNSVQSPTQQLQSFVTSTMQSSAPLHHHQISNQAVPCSPTPSNNPSVSPLHIKSIYSEEQQRGLATPSMGASPTHECSRPHVVNTCSVPAMLESGHPIASENGVRNFNKLDFSAGRGAFSSSASNKTSMQRDLYQARSSSDMQNCRHYSRYCHQNAQVPSFGDYPHGNLSQDGADAPMRHSFSQASQRNIHAQFLPTLAYYGATPDIDYLSSCSTAGMSPDRGMPLDYSRSAYPSHGFSDRLTKSALEKTPPNTFVPPNFARLTHL